MRRQVLCSIITAGLLGAATPAQAQMFAKPFEQGEERTVTGEVVDPGTYLREAKHGPGVEDETRDAANAGGALAILEDGTKILYLLLPAQPGENPNSLAYGYANQQVEVTGTVYMRGGIRGIVPTSVEPAKPSSTTN